MKASELRIGNIIFSKKNKGSVVVQCLPGIDMDNYEPIKLTEEILFKYGFIEERSCFKKNGMELFNIADLYFRGQYPIKADIKYVHQLQNLYFALCGEELELK